MPYMHKPYIQHTTIDPLVLQSCFSTGQVYLSTQYKSKAKQLIGIFKTFKDLNPAFMKEIFSHMNLHTINLYLTQAISSNQMLANLVSYRVHIIQIIYYIISLYSMLFRFQFVLLYVVLHFTYCIIVVQSIGLNQLIDLTALVCANFRET